MMSVFYLIVSCTLLAVIVYQDFRHKLLSSVIVLALLFLAFLNSVLLNGWSQALIFMGINLLLISLQLAGVMAYFSIKHKKVVNVVNTYLGSGDLWFYGILVCSFSPVNFVVFNLASCFITLIAYGFMGCFALKNKPIPFAGCLALMMILVVLASQVWHVELYDDHLLYTYY